MLGRLFSQIFKAKRPAAPAAQAPEDPVASLVAAAAKLCGEREFLAAEALLAKALTAGPKNLDALLLQADILRRTRRVEEAMAAYRRVLLLEPRHAIAWLDLGLCHYLNGDYFWARVFYRFANSIDPDHADVWNELGVVEIALGNYEHAEQSLENAVNRNPAHPEAWNNLGLVLARRGDVMNARRHFLRATFLRPDYYMASCNLALACRELQLFDEADDALRRALEIRPGGIEALITRGSLLQDLGQIDEAERVLEAACAAQSAGADAWSALSALQLRRGEGAAAEKAARRALECDPTNADARLALAHVQLVQRCFAEGWDNYEARADGGGGASLRRLPFAPWNGENPRGTSVLVYGEQGLGDEIMFGSCLPDLVATGARVVLDCDPRLRALFKRSLPTIHVVADPAEYLSPNADVPIDRCIPIGSLPRFFRRAASDFPPGEAYLRVDPERARFWRGELNRTCDERLRVGITWRGGLAKTGRELRSVSLDVLRPMLGVPDVHWVSLQHDATQDELQRCAEASGSRFAVWSVALKQLDETAALIDGLDVVISVCSTVVHLGGALGKGVWVLTPKGPAWRYFAAGRSLPWYRSVKLFRQSSLQDWRDPIAMVAEELRTLAAARAAEASS